MQAELVDGVASGGVHLNMVCFFRNPRRQRRQRLPGLRKQLVSIAGAHDRYAGECILLVESYELFRETQIDAARAAGRLEPKTRRVRVPRSLRRFVQGRREIETLR